MSNTTDNNNKDQQDKPWGDASRSLVDQIEAGSKECTSCRIVGSATFAGVGIYALMQARASAPGTPAQKRIIGGLGIGTPYLKFRITTVGSTFPQAMLVGSAIRWYQCEFYSYFTRVA